MLCESATVEGKVTLGSEVAILFMTVYQPQEEII